MSKLIEDVIEMIQTFVDTASGDDKGAIRVESFFPNVYRALFRHFKDQPYVEGHLAYAAYSNRPHEYQELQQGGWVDLDDHLTYYRNSIRPGHVVLLLGSEQVEDQGGLSDFHCIDPTVIHKRMMGEDLGYARWFSKGRDLKSKDRKQIDEFFRTLFNELGVPDLAKLDQFVDACHDCESGDDILSRAREMLPKLWGLPHWTKPVGKDKGYIEDAIKFVRRVNFEDLTPSKIRDLDNRIKSYANSNDIASDEINSQWEPFQSFSEMSYALEDFLLGNPDPELKKKLLSVDFGLTREILGFQKRKTRTKTKKQFKEFYGDPLEFWLEMVNYYDAVEIVAELTDVDFAGVPSDNSSIGPWKSICVASLGVLHFLNNGEDKQPFTIRYENDRDPFLDEPSNFQYKKTSKYHQLHWSINVRSQDTEEEHYHVVWKISQAAWWLVQIPHKDVGFYLSSNISRLTAASTPDDFEFLLDTLDLRFVPFRGVDNEKELAFFNAWAKYTKILPQAGFYGSLSEAAQAAQTYNEWISSLRTQFYHAETTIKAKIEQALYVFFVMDNESAPCHIVIPPWHPAILEKRIEQARFRVQGAWEVAEGDISDREWDRIFQLSEIISGLEVCILQGGLVVPEPAVGGFFLAKTEMTAGKPDITPSVIMEDEGEEPPDTTTSQVTKLMEQHLKRYLETFPSYYDGIRILLYKPRSLHVVSQFLRSLRKPQSFSADAAITVYVRDENRLPNRQRRLQQLLDEQDDGTASINLRLVYQDKVDAYPSVQLTFIDQLTDADPPDFRPDQKTLAYETRFPMVNRSLPIFVSSNERAIGLSQPQFRVAYAYTQLVEHVCHPFNSSDNVWEVVIQRQVGTDVLAVVNKLHEVSDWVVTMDTALDRSLIEKAGGKIIAFSTGLGNYGEQNLTVSANELKSRDVEMRLPGALRGLFSGLPGKEITHLSNRMMEVARISDGADMLRALSPGTHTINAFAAHMVTAVLKQATDSGQSLRVMVSLDTHEHWFAGQKRADYLILEIDGKSLENETGPLTIRATIIENKAGMINGKEILHGFDQVRNTYRVLSEHWATGDHHTSLARFWRSQLLSLFTYAPITGQDNSSRRDQINKAFRKVLDGQFTIRWTGEVYGYGNLLVADIPLGAEDPGCPTVFRFVSEHEVASIMGVKATTLSSVSEEAPLSPPLAYSYWQQNECQGFTPIVNGLVDNSLTSQAAEQRKTYTLPYEKNEVFGRPEDIPILPRTLTNVDTGEHRIRLLIGRDVRTKEPVYWEYGHPSLPNRHLTITGNSGTGKTYTVQVLLLELVRQGLPAIVFDYTGGFTQSQLDPHLVNTLGTRIKQHVVKAIPFPINPFKPQKTRLGDQWIEEQPYDVASRIRNILSAQYNFGEQQGSAVYRSVKTGVDDWGAAMDLDKLKAYLEKDKENSSASKSVLSKIQQLIDSHPFDSRSELDWGAVAEPGTIFVIQLLGYQRDIQVLLTELIVWDAWAWTVINGNEKSPFTVVLDEVQNLDPGEYGPVGRILTEGRKFGWSGWFATQFFPPSMQKAGGVERLQQSSIKLIFNPPQNILNEVVQLITTDKAQLNEWKNTVARLRKGQCVVVGYAASGTRLVKAAPRVVDIIPIEERLDDGQ